MAFSIFNHSYQSCAVKTDHDWNIVKLSNTSLIATMLYAIITLILIRMIQFAKTYTKYEKKKNYKKLILSCSNIITLFSFWSSNSVIWWVLRDILANFSMKNLPFRCFRTLGLGKQCRPDQTAPRWAVSSGSSLFAIQFASFWLKFELLVWILGRIQQFFLASENLGTLRYTEGAQ